MSWTPVPGAGQKVRGTVLSSLFTEVRPLSSRLTADTGAVNNSSTLVATGLSVTVAANTVYDMFCSILYNGLSAAADLKIGFTYPTGATALINILGVTTADAGQNVQAAADQTTSFTFGTSGGADRAGLLLGQWIVGSTAGTVTVQFAQVTPTAVNSVLRAGSRLILRQQE